MCLLMLMISAFPFYINLFLQYGTFHLKPASQLSFSRRLHCDLTLTVSKLTKTGLHGMTEMLGKKSVSNICSGT